MQTEKRNPYRLLAPFFHREAERETAMPEEPTPHEIYEALLRVFAVTGSGLEINSHFATDSYARKEFPTIAWLDTGDLVSRISKEPELQEAVKAYPFFTSWQGWLATVQRELARTPQHLNDAINADCGYSVRNAARVIQERGNNKAAACEILQEVIDAVEKWLADNPQTTGNRQKATAPDAGEGKKKTAPNEATPVLVAALLAHHEYDPEGERGSIGNWNPIGVREIAEKSSVATGTASRFFRNLFEGHAQYKQAIAEKDTLMRKLKALAEPPREHNKSTRYNEYG